MSEGKIGRRTFVAQAGAMGAALAVTGSSAQGDSVDNKSKRVRVGVIGCGSVSRAYLPHLSKSPHVELVSTCDIIEDRARSQADAYEIPNHYAHIDAMLGGEEFDLLVNLTDMQEHERLNRRAIESGKHLPVQSTIRNNSRASALFKITVWLEFC